MSAAELLVADKNGKTRWDYILGDPANYVAPLDPHMIEADAPRSGADPIFAATLSAAVADSRRGRPDQRP